MKKLSMLKCFVKRKVASFATYIAVLWANTYMMYCDIFDDIGNAGVTFQDKLVATVTILLPLIVIIDIVAIVITRDQRKLAFEITLLISSVIGFIAMLIIDKGTLVDTLKTIVE